MAYYILKITYIIFNAYDNPVNTVMKFSRASVLSFFLLLLPILLQM